MHIALRQGQTTHSGKKFMSTERPHHFGHLMQVSKISFQPLNLNTYFHDFKV